MLLKGKTALITGGGRGIGKAIAFAYAREGANVAIAARTKEEIKWVATQIRRNTGQQAIAITADITREKEVISMLQIAIEKLDKIDILVNNAGVTDKEHRLVRDLPAEVWNKIITTNLTGTFLCSKHIIPHMVSNRSGNIINITSLLGQKGMTRKGEAAYSASKFGIEGLTEVLSKELFEHGINVNALYPAAKVATGFFDHLSSEEKKRLESPNILIQPAIFLAMQSPMGVTGESVNAKRWHNDTAYRDALIQKLTPELKQLFVEHIKILQLREERSELQ